MCSWVLVQLGGQLSNEDVLENKFHEQNLNLSTCKVFINKIMYIFFFFLKTYPWTVGNFWVVKYKAS